MLDKKAEIVALKDSEKHFESVLVPSGKGGGRGPDPIGLIGSAGETSRPIIKDGIDFSCEAQMGKGGWRKMFNQYAEHEKITAQMSLVYKAKNADYGDSFHKSHVQHGSIAAVVRMHDKLQRIDNLLLSGKHIQVKDEAVEDTLLDLANYAIMLIVELRRAKESEV